MKIQIRSGTVKQYHVKAFGFLCPAMVDFIMIKATFPRQAIENRVSFLFKKYLTQNTMTKLKVKSRFAVTPNELLNNPEISFKAKGLFAFIQSKPDGWDFSIERIKKQTKEGKGAIQSAVKELEEAGYLKRDSVKNKKGQWEGYGYTLYDNPSTENPPTDNPTTENPVTLSNKEYSKKEIVKKNNKLATSKVAGNEVNQVFEVFSEINPTMNWGNKTTRKAAEDLIKKFGLEDTLRMARLVVDCQGQTYAPTATTPYQMKEKLAQFKIYFNKQKQIYDVIDEDEIPCA